jgi:hypothetical protein
MLGHEQITPALDQGARILHSVVRPYPAKTAGIPLRFEYEMATGVFEYEWASPDTLLPPSAADDIDTVNASVSHPPLTGHPTITSQQTEIFVPALLTQGRKLVVRGLKADDSYVYEIGSQTLFINVGQSQPGSSHKIKVTLEPPLVPVFLVNSFWSDFGLRIFAIGAVLLGMAAYWSLDLSR